MLSCLHSLYLSFTTKHVDMDALLLLDKALGYNLDLF